MCVCERECALKRGAWGGREVEKRGERIRVY